MKKDAPLIDLQDVSNFARNLVPTTNRRGHSYLIASIVVTLCLVTFFPRESNNPSWLSEGPRNYQTTFAVLMLLILVLLSICVSLVGFFRYFSKK